MVRLDILDYARTAAFRDMIGDAGHIGDDSTHYFSTARVVWRNTADAITVIRLFPETGTNFVAGSRLAVYGR